MTVKRIGGGAAHFPRLRDADATLRWLERAFDDRSGWLVFLAVEPEFESMRGRADFQQLLARPTLEAVGRPCRMIELGGLLCHCAYC